MLARTPLLLAASVVVIVGSAFPAFGQLVRTPRAAALDGGMSFRATLDGQPLGLSSSGDPIILDPDRNSTLSLDLINQGRQPVTVRQVQIRGQAFGITLLAYDVTINATVPAQSDVKVDVPVEFVDLGQQTDGLLPATIRLISPNRTVLGSQDFTVDVRGSASSLMAIFTIVVAIGSAASVAAIWIAVARRRLPPNRFRRGIRFGVTGAGIGVTLTLLLSELLLVTPKGSVWIPLLVVPTAGAFVLGYLSPGPLAEEDEEEEEGSVEGWMRTAPIRQGETVISGSANHPS